MPEVTDKWLADEIARLERVGGFVVALAGWRELKRLRQNMAELRPIASGEKLSYTSERYRLARIAELSALQERES